MRFGSGRFPRFCIKAVFARSGDARAAEYGGAEVVDFSRGSQSGNPFGQNQHLMIVNADLTKPRTEQVGE
jgi:hypothetical protein